MSDPCVGKVSEAGNLDEQRAKEMILKVQNIAKQEALKGGNVEEALRDIAGQIVAEEKVMEQIQYRNKLLSIAAKRRISSYIARFPTMGEGLRAYMEGSSKKIEGARNSVDYQAKALHGKYFGRMISEMESKEVLKDFMKGEHELDIFHEMEQLSREDGTPGSSGNKKAMEIAKIIESVTDEMVAQQNAAGAYIKKLPGYIIRQTHDRSAIRRAGGIGNSDAVKQKSFEVWRDHTTPLLDPRTYKGEDPEKFLRKVHDNLYSGIHAHSAEEAEVVGMIFTQNLAKKASSERVLHFKDSDSAFKYNQEFGVKSLSEAIFGDLHYRARSIAMMENFGPNPEATLQALLRDLQEKGRDLPDSAEQVDSLRDWRIEAAFNTISGKNDIPSNPNLSKMMNGVRAFTTLTKMGGVLLSSVSDKVFMQTSLAKQGIGNLQILGKQITSMLGSSPENKKMLRLMGVAMDGLIGSTVSRYSLNDSVAGFAHRAQQKFFDLNFLNWWTDTNKSAAGELMAGHLGEHANLLHDKLPQDLRDTLALYDINGPEWDALRDTVYSREDTGNNYVTPDKVKNIPPEKIAQLIEQRGLKPSDANIVRGYAELESRLRTYFADQIDYAIPTPGAAEKKYITMNTRAGTPLGETIRMLTLFRSFPLTVMTKLVSREVYGNGSMTIGHWLKNDHKGKFNLAMLVAMATVAGYISGAIRDALKGRTPKELIDADGNIVMATINDAAIRGGGMGIMGDFLFSEYDRSYKNLSSTLAGPVIGQLDPLFDMTSKIRRGENIADEAGKFMQNNTPYINLFYIRPVLDYFVFWNMQEMMNPGSLHRMEENISKKNHQGFFMRPSETVNQ